MHGILDRRNAHHRRDRERRFCAWSVAGVVTCLLSWCAWRPTATSTEAAAPSAERILRLDGMHTPVTELLALAERGWSVRFCGYDLEGLSCVIPAGDYTLQQWLDKVGSETGLSWSDSGGGRIVLTRKDRQAAAAKAVQSRPNWSFRERLALAGVRLLGSLSEDLRARLRDGHRIGTWRLSEATLQYLPPILPGRAADPAALSPLRARSFLTRYAHSELEVRFEPEVLVYRGEHSDPQGRYDAVYRLVPLPIWGQAVLPRYQPAPEDLPPGGGD